MKKILTIFLVSFSISSWASWNEVECKGVYIDKSFQIEIERSFPNDSHFKRAILLINHEGTQTTHEHFVSRRRFGYNRLEYWSAGLNLEINVWPDQSPRWGRYYPAQLFSPIFGSHSIRSLSCRFPNAL